jgi:hypothetical protein
MLKEVLLIYLIFSLFLFYTSTVRAATTLLVYDQFNVKR